MNTQIPWSEPNVGLEFKPPGFEDEVVFLVDDDEALRDGLKRFLSRSGFNISTFGSANEALAAIDECHPRVIVTDKEMPEMSGIEFAERILEADAGIRIIIMTGAGGEASAQAALRLGAADYLTKPLNLAELARSIQRALTSYAGDDYARSINVWLRAEVERQAGLNRDIMLGTLASLVKALEARNSCFSGHSNRVAGCAEELALALNVSSEEARFIHTAGLLHDIGMIAIPDRIVEKPGPLEATEQELVRGHCRAGAAILEPMAHLGPAITYVLEHHERVDGSGYPDGKRRDEISRGGQIVGLAETWTALTEGRTYRDRMSAADAKATLMAATGQWFGEDVMMALLRVRTR